MKLDLSAADSASFFKQGNHIFWWTRYIERVSFSGLYPSENQIRCLSFLKTEAEPVSETSWCIKYLRMDDL
jgi:hypothetical protein